MGLRKEKREGDESAFVTIAPRFLVDQADPIASRSISRTISRGASNARDLIWEFFSSKMIFSRQVIFGEIDPRRSYIGHVKKGVRESPRSYCRE